MADTSTPTLLDRLRAAKGPDRELDAEIAHALGQTVTYSTEIHPQPCGDDGCYLPEWTASLDAALALAERVLPGWAWSMSYDPPETTGNPPHAFKLRAPNRATHGEGHWYHAPTAPLAVLIALLSTQEPT